MTVTRVTQTSMKEYIYEVLVKEIVDGGQPAGSRLPSIKELAERFETSVYTVHHALSMLEGEGYVEKRRGSGTYIADSCPPATMSEAVAVCMRSQSHVWGKLSLRLSARLHKDHVVPVVVNPSSDNAPALLRRLARSGVRAFVLRGTRYFPIDIFDSPVFSDKIFLGFIDWEKGKMPGLLRVLSDYRAGGRMLARHLYRAGHRRALIVASPHQTDRMVRALGEEPGPEALRGAMNHGVAFLRAWRNLGGCWETIHSEVEGIEENELVGLDIDDLISRFRRDDAPTAVFGWRDVEAAAAQKALLDREPDLLEEVEVAGYFDTPWSRSAHPPFTTVSLDIPALVSEACDALETALSGQRVERTVRWVQPQLVVRRRAENPGGTDPDGVKGA